MVIEKNYLFSKRIPVGQFYGKEPEEIGIELIETDGQTAARLQKGGQDSEQMVTFFNGILAGIIKDHDYQEDDIHKWTAEEVAKHVASRAELCLYLMSHYVSDVLFTHGKKSGEK